MIVLHTADLHLGAALSAHLQGGAARERREELLLTFSRLVDYALSVGAEAVLIAGDLFDTSSVAPSLLHAVCETIRSAPSLRFFAIEGNHDRGVLSHVALPDNLTLFRDTWQTVTLGEVSVSGCSTPPKPFSELTLPEGSFHVVMAHGGLGDEIRLSDAKRLPIGYLALGDWHSYRVEPLENGGVAAYPGTPEGHGFDECGDKGVILFDTVRKEVNFVPLCRRRYHEIEVDVTGLSASGAIREAMNEALRDCRDGDYVRVTLTGKVPPDTTRNTAALRETMRSRFALAEVRDRTTLQIFPDEYRHDITLKGEFVRTVLAEERSDGERDAILRCGLAALRGDDVMREVDVWN